MTGPLAKRSFVELPVEVPDLAPEVAALPASAWRTTLWGTPHCSVAHVVLRGGATGGPEDFTGDAVADRPELAALPQVAALIGPDGPFGGCRYAFLFRMAPGGVTLAHVDGAEVWSRLHRVHVPITTHPAASLVVEGRACHLAVGRAWTFDNQALHGFSNGPTERVHLILDAPPSARLDALLARGVVRAGEVDRAAAARTLERERGVPSYPGDPWLRASARALRDAGWSVDDTLAWLAHHQIPHPVHGAAWTADAVAALL